MNWIDRILESLVNTFVIRNDQGDPYMCRYKLLKLPFFRIYLHHILRSDEEVELHDHPWHFVSVILWSGYLEVLRGGRRRLRAGAVVRHRATDSHRLILARPAWTLVFVTGEKRAWGFHTPAGWVESEEFFKRQKASRMKAVA